MNLPPEILGNIFIHLDAVSLMRCQRVSTLWRREAKLCQSKQPDFWKSRCVQEIGWDFLRGFIKKLYPIYFTNKSTKVKWKRVYMSWFSWKLISMWPARRRNLGIKRTGRILRAETYGKWIVYATNYSGALVAFKKRKPFQTAKYLYKGPPFKDFFIYENFREKPLNLVVIFTGISIKYCDLERGRSLSVATTELEWRYFKHRNMAYQMLGLIPGVNLMHLAFPPLPDDVDGFNLHSGRQCSTKWISLHKNVELGFSHSFDRPQIVAFFMGNEYRMYYPSPSFGKITAALLHGDNFFLSSAKGMLYHYTIENLREFLEFNLLAFDWQYKVHGEASKYKIQSIDVCELYKRPSILVTIGKCRIVTIDF